MGEHRLEGEPGAAVPLECGRRRRDPAAAGKPLVHPRRRQRPPGGQFRQQRPTAGILEGEGLGFDHRLGEAAVHQHVPQIVQVKKAHGVRPAVGKGGTHLPQRIRSQGRDHAQAAVGQHPPQLGQRLRRTGHPGQAQAAPDAAEGGVGKRQRLDIGGHRPGRQQRRTPVDPHHFPSQRRGRLPARTASAAGIQRRTGRNPQPLDPFGQPPGAFGGGGAALDPPPGQGCKAGPRDPAVDQGGTLHDLDSRLVAAEDNQPAIILTSVPNSESGSRIARALVEGRLAACVKVLAPCTSTYTWQGKRMCESELPVMIATTAAGAEAAVAALIEIHPYEVPEAIILPAAGGSAAYLDWLAGCVTSKR